MVKLRWLVLALVLAGCGSHARAVAWKPLPPYPAGLPPRAIVPPLPKHARWCRAPSARFVSFGKQGVNSAEDALYFRVRNRGTSTCALRGRPLVTVLSTGGHSVNIDQLPGTFGDVQLAERTFGLAPGKRAFLTVFVNHECDVRSVGAKTTTAVVAVSAVGRTLRIPAKTCAPGVTFALTPWQPLVPEAPPTRFPHLRATIEGHPHARRGTTLVYRVRLAGPTGYRFPWCPFFTESLAPQKGSTYALNCKGVTLPATFEMRFALSRHYRPGMRTLHWRLSGVIDKALAQADAPLRIDP